MKLSRVNTLFIIRCLVKIRWFSYCGFYMEVVYLALGHASKPKASLCIGNRAWGSYPYSMLILLWKLKLYRYSIRLLQLPKRFAHYVGCMSFKIKILAKYFSWVVPHVNLFSFNPYIFKGATNCLGHIIWFPCTWWLIDAHRSYTYKT